MAFKSKDGRQFTNADSMRSHDRMSGGKAQVEAPEPDGDEPEEEDGDQIAGQHGPAHQIAIEHDHEGGSHMVHSFHPDGHEHHSQHADAAKAHEHARKLAGHGEPDGDEAPRTEGQSYEEGGY